PPCYAFDMALRDLWRRGGDTAGSAETDPSKIAEQMHQLRRLGRPEDARQQLADVLAGGPMAADPDLNRLYWDLCVQLERPRDAAPHMVRALAGQLRSGRNGDAVFGWFELCDRLDPPPVIDLDLRRRLAEAMLAEGHGEAASGVLEAAEVDEQTPLPTLLRLALVASKSRAPNAEDLTRLALGRTGVPEGQRQALATALETAVAEGLRRSKDDVEPDGPIELSSTATAARRLKVAAAIPRSVDGERLTLEFPNGQQKGLALDQVQALAAVRIDEGAGDAYVLIDLFLDSLWSDVEELRAVRLRTRDFSPQALVPSAADPQLALGTLLSNLLASSGAQPLPDAEAACGRPFHGFASVGEYRRRVLEIP
ncbi:MAG: hypothetical protein AAFY88_09045, partial [Acidobacteriota bacterium]